MGEPKYDEETGRQICPLSHRHEPDRVRYSYLAVGTQLCGGHVRGVDENLRRLPGLFELLAAAHLSSGIRLGYAAKSAEEPLIIKPPITEHRGRVIGVLASYVAMVADYRNLSDPAEYSVPHLCRFLRIHSEWILEQEWADDFASEMQDLATKAHSFVYPDKLDRKTRIPCPDDSCTGMLLTAEPDDKPAAETDDDLHPSALTCDTCGMPIPPGAWRTLAKEVHNMSGLVTEEDALLWALAENFRLTGPTLRKWASRGHIGRFERGNRVLYDIDEIKARLTRRTEAA